MSALEFEQDGGTSWSDACSAKSGLLVPVEFDEAEDRERAKGESKMSAGEKRGGSYRVYTCSDCSGACAIPIGYRGGDDAAVTRC